MPSSRSNAVTLALVTALAFIAAAPATASNIGGIWLPTLTYPEGGTQTPAPLLPSTKG